MPENCNFLIFCNCIWFVLIPFATCFNIMKLHYLPMSACCCIIIIITIIIIIIKVLLVIWLIRSRRSIADSRGTCYLKLQVYFAVSWCITFPSGSIRRIRLLEGFLTTYTAIRSISWLNRFPLVLNNFCVWKKFAVKNHMVSGILRPQPKSPWGYFPLLSNIIVKVAPFLLEGCYD